MQSRTVQVRPHPANDPRRRDALVALLALAFERYRGTIEAPAVDFVPEVRVYPDVDINDPEAPQW